MRKCFALSVASLLLSGLLFAQTQVTGSVTDANTGEKLVGANVLVEGTDVGTSTDVDGNYLPAFDTCPQCEKCTPEFQAAVADRLKKLKWKKMMLNSLI